MWLADDSMAPKLSKKQSAKSPLVYHESGVLFGSYELKVNLPLNKRITVQYAIPWDDIAGKPKTTASNVVFYAPFNGDAPIISKGLKQWHRYYPETLGYTIFSMTIEANVDIVKDPEQYYIYPESGWHDLVFKVKRQIEQKYHLQEKPLLIVGESSGGSMAQQMAAAHPDKVAAAAWCGGSRYAEFKSANPVPMLAINTWGWLRRAVYQSIV